MGWRNVRRMWLSAGCTCAYAQCPAPGHVLGNRYVLGNAIGISRQSIAYAAWDRQTEQRVIITEFYPAVIVRRDRMAEKPDNAPTATPIDPPVDPPADPTARPDPTPTQPAAEKPDNTPTGTTTDTSAGPSADLPAPTSPAAPSDTPAQSEPSEEGSSPEPSGTETTDVIPETAGGGE